MSDRNSRRPSVAVIGLDGATFDLIKPWAAAGRLPNFARLMESGAHGSLTSTIHPISPQAWTTFLTGMNAGKHGLYDFVSRPPGSYRFSLTHGGYRRGRSLWARLSEAGKRVAVVNVPFTFPPEPVSGIMISGFDAPRADTSLTHPPELLAELVRDVGGYMLHEMYPVGLRRAEYEAVLLKEIQNRVDVTRYLVEREPWDFFMVVVNATDLVQHLFWAEMEQGIGAAADTILHVYEAVDAAVGELLAIFGQDDMNCIVMSDHGAGVIRKTVYLNEWLKQQGWLTFREEARGGPKAAKRLAARGLNQLRRRMKESLPRAAKDWLKQKIPGVRDQVESWLQTSDIDWPRTQAFCGGNFGNIYINVIGREEQGTVEPGAAYDRLVAEIQERLLDLRDPDDGTRIVDQVHRRDTLYHGPFVDDAPDLIVQWRDYAYHSYPALGGHGGDLFGPPPVEDATEFVHSGTHRLHGILLATGPDIAPGLLEGARIVDLAPTLLHLMGLPVAREMDGRVLNALLRDPRPVTYTEGGEGDTDTTPAPQHSVYEGTDESEVAERLRALGYLK